MMKQILTKSTWEIILFWIVVGIVLSTGNISAYMIYGMLTLCFIACAFFVKELSVYLKVAMAMIFALFFGAIFSVFIYSLSYGWATVTAIAIIMCVFIYFQPQCFEKVET